MNRWPASTRSRPPGWARYSATWHPAKAAWPCSYRAQHAFRERICDYVYVLDSGSLIAQGNADQVVNDPVVIEGLPGGDDDDDA